MFATKPSISRKERLKQYKEIFAEAMDHDCVVKVERELVLTDLFYLLAFVCGRVDIKDSDFIYARCCEVQENPDGYLDIWAREHYKSTVITFGKTIQDILGDPNITICIFSHTKPISRGFLRQIKYELETNERLQDLFPEILDKDPKREALAEGRMWSEDKGLTVKRTANDKESTLESYGLVDGMPTGKHFKLLIYDDIVVPESVTSPEMIKKTTEAMSLSYNLGARGGRRRWIGTRYHFADTYQELMDRGTVRVRLIPATANGQPDGEPVFLDKETLAQKRRDMGPFVFACQMLQNPVAGGTAAFNKNWIRYWPGIDSSGMNVYITVDPAHSKKKGSDYTVMMVIGLGLDQNYYIIDMVRDRLNLGERTEALFRLHRRYRPLNVGYERYGLQADIEHMNEEMTRRNYRFGIQEMGGVTSKVDRIARMIPKFEQGRVYIPALMTYVTKEGEVLNLTDVFIDEEYRHFPVSKHDDMLDALARIEDLDTSFPRFDENDFIEEDYEEMF